ncbi:MAG: hypothetical protein IK017_01365 [Paludibacteraceae bacterium]|nr:hypothetical protein [Paludibacteraceae bacterium]
MPFALVPWRHHVEIITKCKSIDEALFYVGKTIEQGLSRDAFINCIKANLYEHQGKIVNTSLTICQHCKANLFKRF